MPSRKAKINVSNLKLEYTKLYKQLEVGIQII